MPPRYLFTKLVDKYIIKVSLSKCPHVEQICAGKSLYIWKFDGNRAECKLVANFASIFTPGKANPLQTNSALEGREALALLRRFTFLTLFSPSLKHYFNVRKLQCYIHPFPQQIPCRRCKLTVNPSGLTIFAAI
jgi:hypothetical protein